MLAVCCVQRARCLFIWSFSATAVSNSHNVNIVVFLCAGSEDEHLESSTELLLRFSFVHTAPSTHEGEFRMLFIWTTLLMPESAMQHPEDRKLFWQLKVLRPPDGSKDRLVSYTCRCSLVDGLWQRLVRPLIISNPMTI